MHGVRRADANGPIHMGHALNKVLKDVTTKARRMSGTCCPFIPGWDCHGAHPPTPPPLTCRSRLRWGLYAQVCPLS